MEAAAAVKPRSPFIPHPSTFILSLCGCGQLHPSSLILHPFLLRLRPNFRFFRKVRARDDISSRFSRGGAEARRGGWQEQPQPEILAAVLGEVVWCGCCLLRAPAPLREKNGGQALARHEPPGRSKFHFLLTCGDKRLLLARNASLVIPEGCGEGSQGCAVFRATPGRHNTRRSRPGSRDLEGIDVLTARWL